VTRKAADRNRRAKRRRRGVKRPPCGAKTRAGGECRNQPVEGGERCRQHGGRLPGRDIRPQVVSGRYSAHFQALSAEGRIRLAELEADPDLLEVRKPVALSALVMAQTPLEPDVDRVWALAEQIRDARISDGGGDQGPEPSAVDIWRAWMSELRGIHSTVRAHASVVNAAHQRSKAGELLMAGAAPFMARLADLIRGTLERRLRSHPRLRDEIIRDLQASFAAVAAQIAAAGE